MVGIYFSGTGNTEYVVRNFIKNIDKDAAVLSISNPAISEAVKQNDFIIFGYPNQFSGMPKIVQDFIDAHKTIFVDKKVFVIATTGVWRGDDAAGVGARAIKKCGAKIVGGLHIKMPDSIADEKFFAKQDCSKIIARADKEIEKSSKRFQNGKPTKHGLSILNRIGGLFGQRLWFGCKTRKYHSMPKVNSSECIGCGICAEQCPTNNLELQNGKIRHRNKCTLCYRCVNTCPKQALTIMGKKVHKQHILESPERK